MSEGSKSNKVNIVGLFLLLITSILGIACSSMLLSNKCNLTTSDKWFSGLLLGGSLVVTLMSCAGIYMWFADSMKDD